MFNSGLPQINVSPRSPFSSGSPNRASNRPSRPRLNPYRTPGRPTLPTSYSSTSSINTTSTTDSTFSIRSFSSDSSPVTSPSDVEQSTNLWSNIRPRNLSVSPTRAPRKPRYRPQKIAPQPRSDGDQGQVEVQDNDEYVNHDDCQDEVELKVPGAFLDYAEEPVVHRNRSLEIDNNSNSTSVQYPILPTVEPQYPRFTSYGSSRKSTREINHSIRSLLQKPLKPHCDLTAGYIYAFESPIYAPSHIKIGRPIEPSTRNAYA